MQAIDVQQRLSSQETISDDASQATACSQPSSPEPAARSPVRLQARKPIGAVHDDMREADPGDEKLTLGPDSPDAEH